MISRSRACGSAARSARIASVRVGAHQQNRLAATLGAGDTLERFERRKIDVGEGGADRAGADHRLDLGRRPVGDDAATGHQHRAVGERVGLLEVMRREENGLAPVGEPANGRPERMSRLDVHADRGLVEHQQVGVADQRDREPHALGLPTAQPVGSALRQVGNLRDLECLVDRQRRRVERGHHRDELSHREVLQQPTGLQHRADPAVLDGFGRRLAEDRDGPAVGFLQAQQHVDGRRLAGTVRAEQRDRLPGGYLDIDAADGANRPARRVVRLLQPEQLDSVDVRHAHEVYLPGRLAMRQCCVAAAAATVLPYVARSRRKSLYVRSAVAKALSPCLRCPAAMSFDARTP